MMIAYMEAVARDRAADRGCTGGGEVADDTGPPGEIPRGFSFSGRSAPPNLAERRPPAGTAALVSPHGSAIEAEVPAGY